MKTEPSESNKEKETRLALQKAKIEAEIRKKIEIERRREKVLGLIKKLLKRENLIKIGIGIVVLLVIVIGGCGITRLIKSRPKPAPAPLTPPPVEPIEKEKPPEDFEIQVEKLQMISTNGKYDIIARVKNTDPNWGVSKLDYIFQLLDVQGNIVGERKGLTFVLPLSKRSIIEVGIEAKVKVQEARLKLDLKEVQKLKSLPDLGISTRNVVYHLVENRTKGKASGSVLNRSPYSFKRVYLNIVLYDREGNILGLNHTYVENLLSGQERYFSAYWPEPPKEWVDRVEVEPLVDLFKSTAFIKEYKKGEPLEW